jgi:hypothetical protein
VKILRTNPADFFDSVEVTIRLDFSRGLRILTDPRARMEHMRSAFNEKRSLFWALQLSGWAAYGLSSFFSSLPGIESGEWFPFLLLKLFWAALGLGASLVLYQMYRRLSDRATRPRTTAAFAAGLSLVLGAAWYLAYRFTAIPLFWSEGQMGWEAVAGINPDYAFVLLAWSGAYFALQHWRQIESEKHEALEARVLASEAKLEAISCQLNPRFLLGALGSIRGLISDNPSRAKETVKRLSEFLRHALVNPPFEETLLAREVEALRSYLAIEEARFEENLDVDIDITPDAAASRVPALVLHPLVENAVQYGEPDESRALRVRLRAHRDNGQLFLQVANTGRLEETRSKVRPSSNGSGIGLDDVRKRLDHFYPESHSFQVFDQDGWVYAVVEINERAREKDDSAAA